MASEGIKVVNPKLIHLLAPFKVILKVKKLKAPKIKATI